MSTLEKTEIDALFEALDDEYQAWATYDQVIRDFGNVRPFSNIREAEARHINALCSLLNTYSIPVPDNTWPDRVARYRSLQEACEAGVSAEIANGQLYDRLLKSTKRPDIRRVYRHLQDASQQRHLSAFQRCVERQAE